MAKLPKRLIKKYGISKKAWAVFRSEQKGRSRSAPTKRKTTKKKYQARSKRKSTKKTSSKKKSGNMNLGGDLGKGLITGAAIGVINRFIPVNIAGADYIIAGMLMKDKTVQKLGLITLGRSLAGSLTGSILGGGNGNGSGGGY